MAQNYVLLETINLTQQAGSVVFDNIPQTGYNELKIVFSALGNGVEGLYIRFNNSTTNFSGIYHYGDGANTSSASLARYLGSLVNSATVPNNGEVHILDYTGSNPKPFLVHEVAETNTSTGFNNSVNGIWDNSAAITSITLEAASAFRANSTFSLYGIASLGTTPVTAPFATGGNIVANDGTYWYHAFLNSGTFTPTKALSCDVLVVAGGGGGGYWNGGGGGAGGLLTHLSQSLTAINYPVTVGSGGAGGTSGAGTFGVNSQFGSLTASVGGGGGAQDSTSAANGGGSGGGAGFGGTGGNAVTGQGNVGGNGDNGAPVYGGGGGGAGGAGTTGQIDGKGGIGLTSSLTNAMGSATTTGQLSSSNYYYAGGGSGGNQNGTTLVTGGLGGGGTSGTGYNTTVVQPTAGTANTGGGGGGGTAVNPGASGGSGIVIVRYPMAS